MPVRSLPLRPSLHQLKLQAKELHRAHRERSRSAAARIVAHHPAMKDVPLQSALARRLALADAQLVIAREHGFDDWSQLKHRVELGARLDRIEPHPLFDEALAALDAGDLERLRSLIASDGSLVRARTNLQPPYGYFTGATLLHHVAGNPWRHHPLPQNVVEIARLLLESGAEVNASTLGPAPSSSLIAGGATTMGLLVTSRQASEAGVTGSLMDLLLERGATLDLKGEGALDASLANHAPRAAEKMIDLGVEPDILAAAALGRMDRLRGFFDGEGRLRSRLRRHGREMADRDAIGLALLYAYVRHQREAVDFLLEKDGNWDITGVNNGTALHHAAWAGDLEMVKRLVATGADVNNRDNPFRGTPMGWASHNGQGEVVRWIQEHCAVDLHDAVAFDLAAHIQARLREDPLSVDRRMDDGEITQGAPLHAAARLDRGRAATILLETGADPNLLAGNGLTPLDVADSHGSGAVARLLEQHGATRTVVPAATAVPSELPVERGPMSPTSTSPASATVVQPERPAEDGARAKGQDVEGLEQLAEDVLDAYRSGSPAALGRIQGVFKRPVTQQEVRSGAQRRLHKASDADISLAEAQDVVAGLRGFASWAALVERASRAGDGARTWALPLYRIDDERNVLRVRHALDEREWDAVLAVMAEKRIAGLDANGQMTDAMIAQVARLDHVARLDLAGSRHLTDAGLRHLARLPGLHHLDLSGTAISNEGLTVLRELGELRTFRLHHQGVTDDGTAHLADCHRLERVAVFPGAGVRTLRALAGKPRLRNLQAGRAFTEDDLALLHEYPVFKTWQGGEVRIALMEFEAEPNYLIAHPATPYSRGGLAHLVGLEGLFALNLDNPVAKHADLAPLRQLPHLGWLGHDADDESMRQIGELPRLRMLMAQDTVAGDAGFVGLSRSATLEYLWGRRCHNLTGRGFAALSTMPALRGLSVSCKNVDDGALATLPRFPALREFMPMDVPDAGFRHVGRCEELEALWCMYCRDTTDAATEQIAGLSKLKTYYAGQTGITDRSLQILSRMPSLETLTFWNCAGITNAGAALLGALPRLRAISLDSCRHVTPEVTAAFAAHVRVEWSA